MIPRNFMHPWSLRILCIGFHDQASMKSAGTPAEIPISSLKHVRWKRHSIPRLLRPEFACHRSQLVRKKNLGVFITYITDFQPNQTFKTNEKVWKSSSDIEISRMEVSGAQTGLQSGPPGWGKSSPGRGDHPEHFICDNQKIYLLKFYNSIL